ncbi:MAG: DUF1799 domain-containing protein [Veillonellales bacterium]
MAKQDYPCYKNRSASSCNGCEFERPELDPINYDIWYLWGAISTQWRTAVGERLVFVGLDYVALYAVAETLDIEITPAILAKIRLLELSYISRKNAKK